MEQVTLTIDGQRVAARKGSSVLEAALEAGIYIPHLCYDPSLTAYGACRLCVVEIEGMRGLPTSCTVQAAEGMVVRSDGPKVNQVRRVAVELLLADHPPDCLTCPSASNCGLLKVASFLGVERIRLKRSTRGLPIDDSNPFFYRELDKCVLCGRCVRACQEIVGLGVIDFAYRGYKRTISTFGDKPIAQSRCVSCGECVAHCPVGALAPKRRALPSREVRTVCPYCGVGCGLSLGVRGQTVVGIQGDEENLVNRGSLCVKGRFGYDFINHQDRLTTPLIRKGESLVPASWEEALGLVAERFSQYKGSFGAFSSAKCTNEENYLMQKFTRAVMGTNNVDHCARLCHASSVAALIRSFGEGAMSSCYEDIELAQVIITAGDNITETHPVNSERVIRAARRGAKLILIDPREVELVRWAYLHLKLRPGTDVALLNGMMNVILQEELWNKAFVDKRTEGFAEAMEVVKKYPPERAAEITGVPAEKIREAARLYATAPRAIILFGMGIAQHVHGTNNGLALANLAMLCGQIGREGTGLNPLRGQNNVQGACDMGALPNFYPGYQGVASEESAGKFEKAWGRPLSRKVGLTVTEMVEAAGKGELKALYIMGENPMVTEPNLAHAEKAFRNLEFLVVQDIFLTETARLAQVVLPGASFAEKEGTFTNSERRVQRVRKAVEPPGQARPDGEIICDLSSRMSFPGRTSPEQVFGEMASLTPSYSGITYQRLDNAGLQWPCPTPDHPGTPHLHGERFTRGLGKFHPVEYIPCAEETDGDYPLRLTTGRLREHYHSGTMTRRSPGLNTLQPEAFVEVNPADAASYGISQGDIVTVASRRGEIRVKAKVTLRVDAGVLFIPFHFAEAAANILTIDALDPIAKIPEFKSCAVRIGKAA